MADVKTSKFIALVLRHTPEKFGVVLDSEGWTSTSDLIKVINENQKTKVSLVDIEQLVDEDSKGRYSLSNDKKKIRANQGHSTDKVDITFKQASPPDILYHGTTTENLDGIYKSGLQKMSRHHVHLSKDRNTAEIVGKRRRGNLAILSIDAKKMVEDGHIFMISDNEVWLVEHVPLKYLSTNEKE